MVYCVKFNPAMNDSGPGLLPVDVAKVYHGASPEGQRTAKAVLSLAEISEAVLNRTMMNRLGRRR